MTLLTNKHTQNRGSQPSAWRSVTRTRVLAATLAANVLLLASCSSDADTAASDSPSGGLQTSEDVSTPTTDPAPITSSAAGDILTSVGTIDYEGSDGYTWTVEPKFGAIVSVTDPSVDQDLVSACNADSETAGFIPMEIDTTNSSSFTETAATGFLLDNTSDFNDGSTPLQWVSNLQSGPDCQDAAVGQVWTINHNDIPAGGTTSTRGGIIVRDWKSPNYPDGDPVVDHLWLGQPGQAGLSKQVYWKVNSADGPGMVTGPTYSALGTNGLYAFPIPTGS